MWRHFLYFHNADIEYPYVRIHSVDIVRIETEREGNTGIEYLVYQNWGNEIRKHRRSSDLRGGIYNIIHKRRFLSL